MKAIVVANWKMNPATMREAKKLFDATKKALDEAPSISLIIAPPSIYLRELASNYRGRRISFASQNAHFEAKGDFTGEVSLLQIKNAGADHVLVGHSERRAMGETNEDTQKKIAAALGAKVIPILCVGESERGSGGEHFSVVKEQVRVALFGLTQSSLCRVIVAYEPGWAIGGETTITPQEMHTISIFISKTIVDMFGEVGHRVKILYGASIGEQNAAAMMRDSTVKGLIVGHVSRIPERFEALLQSINNL